MVGGAVVSMPIEEVFLRYNVETAPEGHHHARSGWVQADCPWCGRGSHKWHLGYNVAGRYFNCWRCGPKDRVEVLQELTGLSRQQVYVLAAGIEAPPWLKGKEVKRPTRCEMPPWAGNKLTRIHEKYLRGRGFDPDKIVKLWQVSGVGNVAPPGMAWRLFIPVLYRGEMVSWTTRSIADQALRYVSAKPEQESVSLRSILYGEDYVRGTTVVVHEGPTDVWKTGPGAVATFSTGYTRSHLFRLSKYRTRVVCYDAEPEAQARARKLCDELEAFPGETLNVVLESAKDAGAASESELAELRARFLD
jgi:hypothetical protein